MISFYGPWGGGRQPGEDRLNAAVRGDATSDRATAGTDGIDNGGQVGNEVCLRRVRVSRGVARVGPKGRNFGCAGADQSSSGRHQFSTVLPRGSQTDGGSPYENCFTLAAKSGSGV